MTAPHETKVPKLEVILPPSADGSSFATYRSASAAQVEISLPDGTNTRDFFIEGANYQLPHAVLTWARSCAQHLRGVPEGSGPDGAPTIQIYLYVAGTSEAVYDGRHEQLGPDDIVIHDSRRGYETDVTAFDVRIVMVSRDRVPPIFLSPAVHGLRLPGEAAGTRLVADAMKSLIREIDELSIVEADHAVVALCQLAAGAVEAHLARQDRGRRRWGDAQLDAAMAYIERRCRESDLTPDAVRVYLDTSRSAMYRLFAPVGGIEAAIRQRRLDLAMRGLLTGAVPVLSSKDLAVQYGFRNETHFVRAFRARFGATPSQVHKKIAAGDRAWLVAQAGRAGFGSLQAWLAALTSGSLEGSGQVDGKR